MSRSIFFVSALALSLSSAHALGSLITAKASWDGPGDWERTCTVAIENMGSVDASKVRMYFEAPEYPIAVQGITACNKSGKGWYTYMLADLIPLASGQKQECKMQFNFTDGLGSQATLPTNFAINGQSSPDGNDTTPPTVPQNLNYTNLKPYSFALNWKASTDDYGVAGYTVSYARPSDPEAVEKNTTELTLDLTNLLPDTDYKCKVRAFDFSSNLSDFTDFLTVHTEKEVSVPTASGPMATPFIDGIAMPSADPVELVQTAGTSGAIVGFLCDYSGRPSWGGLNLIPNTDTLQYEQGDATQSNYLKEFFIKYPDSVISIGGKIGLPSAANTGLTSETLANLYAGVLDNYQIHSLDFSYIDSFLTDAEAIERDAKAVRQLMTERPDTKIFYTLPADASSTLKGLNQYGYAFLQTLKSESIWPTAVNYFLSNFGDGAQEKQIDAMKEALEGAHSHMKEIFGDKWNDEELWAHMGACPWFGQDQKGKVFSVKDQEDLNEFCQQKGMILMSGWDMIRDTRLSSEELGVSDHNPYDFSKAVAKFVAVKKQPDTLKSKAPSEAQSSKNIAKAPIQKTA